MFDELVPPEVRQTFRRACEVLRGIDTGIAWAMWGGIPDGMIADIEARLMVQCAHDGAHVARLLAAYRHGHVTADEFAQWVEVNLEPERVLARAGLAARSSEPPAAGR